MKLSSNTLSPEQLLERSQSLQQNGRLEEAAQGFEKLRKLYPDFPPVLNSLGTIYLQLGKLKEGCQLLGKSLSLDPAQPMIMFNMGLALQSQNNILGALDIYQQAIKLKTNFFEAMNARGTAFHALGRYEDAIVSYQQSIAINPNVPDAHNNLGISLLALNRALEAEKAFEKSISLNPKNPQPHNNLGLALKKLNKINESIVSFSQAISLNEQYADAYSNRGMSYQAQKNTTAALRDFDECKKLDPNHADNNWNKSLLKILIGDFEEGWRLYEWRWMSFARGNVRKFNAPLWLENEPLNGKTILIYPEQGMGDFIQFCRYVTMLSALGAKVILEAPPALVTLASTIKGNIKVIESGKLVEHIDYQCPVMSLPLAFKTTLASIPKEVPYLFTDQEKFKAWEALLGVKSRPRVGLAWSGAKGQANDHNRSMRLAHLLPLLDLPFEFHSLHKEVRPEDEGTLTQTSIKDHREHLIDFSDTASLIAHMDLVISVDTSVAHLAGALDKKVFILLSFNADYRWLLDREDCPWYPSATLLRQNQIGEWGCLIQTLIHKIS